MTRWLIQSIALLTLLGLLAITAGLHSTPAVAAEAPATDDEAEPAETSQPSSEVFIPTEEISEDFAVSFPVDI